MCVVVVSFCFVCVLVCWCAGGCWPTNIMELGQVCFDGGTNTYIPQPIPVAIRYYSLPGRAT